MPSNPLQHSAIQTVSAPRQQTQRKGKGTHKSRSQVRILICRTTTYTPDLRESGNGEVSYSGTHFDSHWIHARTYCNSTAPYLAYLAMKVASFVKDVKRPCFPYQPLSVFYACTYRYRPVVIYCQSFWLFSLQVLVLVEALQVNCVVRWVECTELRSTSTFIPLRYCYHFPFSIPHPIWLSRMLALTNCLCKFRFPTHVHPSYLISEVSQVI